MSITTKQVRFLRAVQKRCGVCDDDYRVALVHLCGVESTTELDNAGLDVMPGFLEWRSGKTVTRAHGENYGDRPGMASFAQLELIRALWHEYTRGQAGEDALNTWLRNKFKLSSLRFVTVETARKIITALKSMKARAA